MMGFLLTTDYDKAKAFFVEKLEFKFVSLDQFALVVNSGENLVRISKVDALSPLHGTVLGWQVKDIETAVTWLKSRGIVLEKYPFMKNADIWTSPSGDKVAWFKDPDGNLLSVSQHV
jgi:catechol 2,3-dioxygenase-like lactoylglutathione lyase family enzyme